MWTGYLVTKDDPVHGQIGLPEKMPSPFPSWPDFMGLDRPGIRVHRFENGVLVEANCTKPVEKDD